MFEGFTLDRVDVGDVTLRVRHGGSGPPVLLVHGHPRTHTTWHRVAPRLAERFTVVCPDTRGYGESTKPPTDGNHTPYSKRVMAADCVALMRHLGHEEFFVAGHDRGAYVATRLALDHPDAVRGAAILDAVPIAEALDRCDARFAREWYHWFFFAQPEKPERVITADPDAWYNVGTKNTPERLGAENFADFRRAIHDSATVTAMLEDYRAGLASTAPTTRPTAPPGGGSPAPPWCSGRATTTWKTSTATSWPSGGRGRRTCAGTRSGRGTTWPRRTPRHSRPRWAGSSAGFSGSAKPARGAARRRRRGRRGRRRRAGRRPRPRAR